MRRVISPVFDTQIAAACIGLKPQIGYADLVKTLLDVTVPKGQTRTDWSKRPLSAAQLEYAADDVKYLDEVGRGAGRAAARPRARALGGGGLPGARGSAPVRPRSPQAWKRLRNLEALPPAARARGRAVAAWREAMARERDLPRGWIIPDAAIFGLAEAAPANRAELDAALKLDKPINETFAQGLLAALRDAAAEGGAPDDAEPGRDLRPTPEQKALIDRLGAPGRCARAGARGERRDPGAARRAEGPGAGVAHGAVPVGLAARGNRRAVATSLGGPLSQAPPCADAVEHRLHVRVGVDDAQQSALLVVLDQRLGLRLEHLEALADDLFLVVRPLNQLRAVATLIAVRQRTRGAPCRY